jgi:hypothetical protein
MALVGVIDNRRAWKCTFTSISMYSECLQVYIKQGILCCLKFTLFEHVTKSRRSTFNFQPLPPHLVNTLSSESGPMTRGKAIPEAVQWIVI